MKVHTVKHHKFAAVTRSTLAANARAKSQPFPAVSLRGLFKPNHHGREPKPTREPDLIGLAMGRRHVFYAPLTGNAASIPGKLLQAAMNDGRIRYWTIENVNVHGQRYTKVFIEKHPERWS